jgi:hypothetical protein
MRLFLPRLWAPSSLSRACRRAISKPRARPPRAAASWPWCCAGNQQHRSGCGVRERDCGDHVRRSHGQRSRCRWNWARVLVNREPGDRRPRPRMALAVSDRGDIAGSDGSFDGILHDQALLWTQARSGWRMMRPINGRQIGNVGLERIDTRLRSCGCSLIEQESL